ncbi:hypothetical protein T02_5953 [Trichinella nativa]|uniref:Uncharacterized protein n=1 Tax=Trichinella nativa TaxID=6335 RepID=A0A0V1KPQ9_9BILA|nr:hypothetical protein T02_5953 [Trichinella nativa]
MGAHAICLRHIPCRVGFAPDFLLAGCAPCPGSLFRLTTMSELSGSYPVLPSLVSELLLTSDDINPRTLFRTAYKSQRFGIRVAYLFPLSVHCVELSCYQLFQPSCDIALCL